MEINKFFQEFKEVLPDKAIDISESLELVKETINDSIEAFADKVNEAFSKRIFGDVKNYQELAEKLYTYENRIEEIIKMLDIEELDIKKEINENVDNKIIPNYDAYTVNNNIEHSLYENFTHIRPFGFKINDNVLIECKTWQEVFIKTCEILLSKDKKKFISFENNKDMNGKKNKYFSCKPEGIRKPENISNTIYIETNMSGNSIRNLIIKMLKHYEIKINEYKVFFRADYSNLNK